MIKEEFDFSTDFQDLIVACFIRFPDKFARFGRILEPRFFLGVQPTVTMQAVLDYQLAYSRIPAWEALEQRVIDEIQRIGGDEDSVAQVTRYIQRLMSLDTGDVDFVSTRVVEFARERATLAALKANVADIQAGKIDPKLIKRLEDALRIGQDLDDLGYFLHADYERAIRKITDRQYGVRTGYHLFDKIWKHGWSPGWLGIILAPPKRYKTAMCLNLALNIASHGIGENVFYYSCEISQELALARILFNMTGRNQEYMYQFPEKFLDSSFDEINKQLCGHLLIKGYPSKSARISDIDSHISTVEQQKGIKPKIVFIDYAETVTSSDKNMSEHQQSASVYTEARALGAKHNCTVIMPDRCTREAVGLKVPNMTSFQGAFQKAGIVDFAIGQCATEAEYKINTLRWFVFENRHGPAYQHMEGKVDPEVMKIEIIKEIDYNPEDDVGKAAKNKRGKETPLPEELQDGP